MQTTLRLVSLLLLVNVTACGGSAADVASTAAAAKQAGAAAEAAKTRPYKGWCDTEFSMVPTAFLPEATPPVPIAFAITLSGTCQLAHLGLTTLTATQTVTTDLATGLQAVVNSATLTAANGDVLHSAFDGTGTPIFAEDGSGPIGFTFEGDDTYSAGTGRFADASGSATLVGAAFLDPGQTAPPFTGSGHYEVSGTITY